MSTLLPDGVAGEPAAISGVVVSVIIVHDACFTVGYFAGKT